MAMKRKNLLEVVPELFEHEQFGQIRFIKRDEEIWFAAVDVCRVLDLENVTKALYVLDDDEKMTLSIGKGHSGQRGGAQFMNFVNEFGLYNLILSSRKPEAKKFKRWVTHEVLPSIRKYGFYGLMSGERALQLPDAEYIRYLGELDCYQYDAYLDQLTGEQRGKHYRRLQERIDRKDLIQEEILNLTNDPYIIVSRIGHEPWKASY